MMTLSIPKLVNKRGIPTLNANSVSSNGTNTTVTVSQYAGNSSDFSGLFIVRFTQTITTSTQPVYFATEGVSNSSIPVLGSDGSAVTVASFVATGTTFHLMFYDRQSNVLQLMI